MKSLLKGLFGLLALTLLLIISVIAGITLLLNPNDYKQELSTLAAKQGVSIKIEGDIAWQFFPNIGLSVNKLSVHTLEQTDKALVQIETLTASVQFMPLLKKQVLINGIHLTKPHINLRVNEQGQGNWLLQAQGEGEGEGEGKDSKQPTIAPSEEQNNSALEFAMKSLSIVDATLSYSDARNKQTISLNGIYLNGQNINVSEQAFPVDLQLSFAGTGYPNPIALQWHSELTLNNTFSKLQLISGLLKLESDKAALGLKLSAEAQYNNEWLYSASYELEPLNIKNWLEAIGLEAPQTNNINALSQFSLTGKASVTPDATRLDDLELALDDTTFKGAIEFSHQENGAHAIQLAGDNIIVDDYLPPNSSKEPVITQIPNGKSSGHKPSHADQEELFPLESLRSLNFNAKITLQSLKAMDLNYSALKMVASGSNGILKIENFHADFYEGDIDAQATINANGKLARIEENVVIKGVQIKNLMRALVPEQNINDTENTLSGLINAQLEASSEGNTVNQLTENLSAEIRFNTEKLQLTPLNLEEQFCQAVGSLSSQKPSPIPEEENGETQESAPPREWPALTELRNVKGTMIFSQQRLTINDISAGVENLLIGSRGYVDLKQNHYSLQLPMTLKNEFSSNNGCRITSAFVRNRELSLVKCEGTVEPFDTAQACGLDKRALRGVLKDLAKYQAKKKLNSKKDRLLEKANEKFGEGAADLLKQLFKR